MVFVTTTPHENEDLCCERRAHSLDEIDPDVMKFRNIYRDIALERGEDIVKKTTQNAY